MMIYHSILFSFFLMGVASEVDVTTCKKNNNVLITCTTKGTDFTECSFKNGETVLATSKNVLKGTDSSSCSVDLNSTMTENLQKSTSFICSFKTSKQAEGPKTDIAKEKYAPEKLQPCSACSGLQFAGVTLLLALTTPLLSAVL